MAYLSTCVKNNHSVDYNDTIQIDDQLWCKDCVREEIRLLRQRRIHWQDLAYAGMRVIDAVAGNRLECGEGVTEDTCKVAAKMAIDKVKFLKEELSQSREQLVTINCLLREAYTKYTESCVVASENGVYSKEFGVAIVGLDWYEQVKNSLNISSKTDKT